MIEKSNPPSPNVLMTSMRSIGYDFSTAIADIIDNSISANAKDVFISSPISDNPNNKIFLSILDDGLGMDDSELFNAMTYGSTKNYSQNDLGRFGLGLKSASLSQCRILTVLSKKNNEINGYMWDLDEILKTKQWYCLKLTRDEIESQPNYDSLCRLNSGTLVIWENFDLIYKKTNGQVRNGISEEMDRAEEHLRLVFHRFLNKQNNPLNIYINNRKIDGLDPFLERHPKTDTREVSEIEIHGSIVKVQPYILLIKAI